LVNVMEYYGIAGILAVFLVLGILGLLDNLR